MQQEWSIQITYLNGLTKIINVSHIIHHHQKRGGGALKWNLLKGALIHKEASLEIKQIAKVKPKTSNKNKLSMVVVSQATYHDGNSSTELSLPNWTRQL